MRWTTQQETAIADRGRSVIVSAAAGSGKTAVLVERLLRILSSKESGVRSENIVVVTFTNDAAAQMKQRLYQALTEKMNSLGSDANEEEYLWLLEQQSGLSNAKIATINAFCFDLIRENADICGVSSQFRIAEPAEETIYVQNAMQTVLEHWNKTRPKDMEVLFSFFCTRDDSELEAVILAVAEYMKSLAFPEYWSERAEHFCKERTVLFEAIRNAVCSELESVLLLLEKSTPFAESSIKDGKSNKFLERLNEDKTNIQFHLNYVKHAEMDELLENPLTHKAIFANFPTVKKNIDEESKNIFRQFRETYKTKYLDTVSMFLKPLSYFHEDMEIQSRVIPLLLAVTQDFRNELFEEKKRRNVLCFDDGERLALSLLGEMQEDGTVCRSAIGERLSEQYSLIMVDEYQDCNNKQDCLFKLLSQGCSASENGLYYGSNAFLVGDVKQSIYSFRQANPRNFMQALKDSTPLSECRDGEIARIYLNQNFRSSEGVIAFVNGLFSLLMTMQCGEVKYDENEFLYFGAEHYKAAEHTKTTLLLTGEDTPHEESRDTQAECLAAHIAKMLADKTLITCRDNTQRPCEPQDFCILLRSVDKDGKAFIDALEKRGVPVAGEESYDFLGRPEIRLIYNYLRVLDNPLTDISMASVMLSPIYGFTAQDLVDLKAFSRKKRLYLQIRAYLDAQKNQAEVLCHKCSAFMEQLELLRTQTEALPLEKLVLYLYDETDILSLQSLYDDADLRRSNLQALIRIAQDYQKHTDLSAHGTLGGWLRYLDSIAGKGLDIGGLPQTAANCVAVKTIHKSKGLEYPFVFLAHLERGFSRKPKDAVLHTNENGILGLRLIDRENFSKSATIAYHYLLADTKRRQRSEEMRLFYVAMTRAQQQLYLVMNRSDCYQFCLGAYKPKEGQEDALLMAQLLQNCPSAAPIFAAEVSSMLEWVLLYLLAGNEASHFLTALETEQTMVSELAAYLVCNACEPQDEQEPQQLQTHSEISAEVLTKVQDQLAFRYVSGQTDLISKYSVTALSHPEQEFEQQLALPEFLRKSQGNSSHALQGAQRGTAVHKMLQYMDFTTAAKNPQAELERLQSEGFLLPSEAEALAAAKLKAFFDSSLYNRIAAAQKVEKEKQFFVRIGELALPDESPLFQKYVDTDGILIGTMDLLFRESDGWVIVDYKTDYVKKAQELTERYSLQLALYQKAAEQILGEPVKAAYIYSFTLDTAIEVNVQNIKF